MTLATRQPQKVVVADVAVVATGGREAPGGWWGGLSVPEPPKGVAVAGVTSAGCGSRGSERVRVGYAERGERTAGRSALTDIKRPAAGSLCILLPRPAKRGRGSG